MVTLLEICEICGKEFATPAALAQHIKDKHGAEPAKAAVEKTKGSEPSKKGRQKSLRKRNRHPVAIGILAVALVVGVGVYYVAAPAFTAPPFKFIGGESYIHIHPYLQIWIDGQNVTVPGGIGIQQPQQSGGGFFGSNFEPMHTHDNSGIIHIELSKSDASTHNFTLGDFFTIWRWSSTTVMFNGTSRPVVFNSTDILGFKADATHKVILLVDGVSSTDFGNLNLEKLAYCTSTNSGLASSPCYKTAQGPPYWNGSTSGYPYGTGHKIVIEYVKA